jgi:hypothetical protein
MLPLPNSEKGDLESKLWARTEVDKTTGCYLFAGTNQRGHGQLRYDGRSHGVHRLSAMLYLGLNLNDSKAQANHKCPNKNCWNPEHLYIGTQSDNILDAVKNNTYNNQNTIKTHCKRGHPLEGDNLKLDENGERRCKTCIQEYLHEYNKNRR